MLFCLHTYVNMVYLSIPNEGYRTTNNQGKTMFFKSESDFQQFVQKQIEYIQQDINNGIDLQVAYNRHVGHRVYGAKVREAVKNHFNL